MIWQVLILLTTMAVCCRLGFSHFSSLTSVEYYPLYVERNIYDLKESNCKYTKISNSRNSYFSALSKCILVLQINWAYDS